MRLSLALLVLLAACHRLPVDPTVRPSSASWGINALVLTVDLAGADLAGADLATPVDMATPPPDLLPTQVPIQLPRNGTCLRQQWILFSDKTVKTSAPGDIWFDACRNYYCSPSAGQCAAKPYGVFYLDMGCTVARQIVIGSGDDGLALNPFTGSPAKFAGANGKWYTRGALTTAPLLGATLYNKVGVTCTSFKYLPSSNPYNVYVATLVSDPPSGPVTYTTTFTQTP